MKSLRVVLILFLLLPASLIAQDVLGFAVGGGLAVPVGDSSERFGSGPTFGIRTVLPINDRLAFQAMVGYQEIRLQEDVAVVERGHDPATFRLGGGFVEGGNQRSLGVLAQAQLHLLPRSSRLSPYLLAGAGVSQIRTTDFGIYYLGRWDDEPGSSETAFAGDLGAGVQVRVNPIVSFFGQGSYNAVFTEGERTTMAPIVIGLLLELGRE